MVVGAADIHDAQRPQSRPQRADELLLILHELRLQAGTLANENTIMCEVFVRQLAKPKTIHHHLWDLARHIARPFNDDQIAVAGVHC